MGKVVSMLTSYTQKRAETTNTGSRKQKKKKKMGNAIECSDEQAISGLSECTFSQAVVESRI